MSLVQSMRGGRDNDPHFGTRMRGSGVFAELIRNRFRLACTRTGLSTGRGPEQSTALFRPPGGDPAQLDLGL